MDIKIAWNLRSILIGAISGLVKWLGLQNLLGQFCSQYSKMANFYVKLLNEHANFKHWIAWNAPSSPMGKSLQPGHYGILFYVKETKQTKIYEIRMPHERERKSEYLRKDYGGKKAGFIRLTINFRCLV